MRTHILVATAIILSATTALAGPRSLSGAQTNPVEPPPVQKIQILEAPQPPLPPSKVQILEAPQAAEQPKEPARIVEQTAPADTGTVRAAPVEEKSAPAPAAEARPVEAKPEGKQVVTKTAGAVQDPDATPVKAKRKQPRRHASTEQRLEREFRTIGRTIERHIGVAITAAAPYSW